MAFGYEGGVTWTELLNPNGKRADRQAVKLFYWTGPYKHQAGEE